MKFDELLAQMYFRKCARCGVGSLSVACQRCRTQPLAEKRTETGLRIFSLGFYDSSVGESIRLLKYHQETAHAARLGRIIAPLIPSSFSGATLVPVPLHPLRLAERGYNQAALIARAIAQSCRLKVAFDLLTRTNHGTAQATLGESARASNLTNTFQAKDSSKSSTLVLVDDVATTGSTLDACRKALESAGHPVLGALSCAISRGGPQHLSAAISPSLKPEDRKRIPAFIPFGSPTR